MSAFEEDVLFGALLKAMCWRDLHDPHIGGSLDAEDFLELAKAAGLGPRDVEKLIAERAWQRMKKELPV